jgi:hypothetical protein
MDCRILLSLILATTLLVALGCNRSDDKKADAKKSDEAKSAEAKQGADHHEHGDGPHGGTIADWGGGTYHVEFTVDHGKKEATVYVLGGDAKSPAPVKADKLSLSINEPAFQVELKPQPLEGEAAGTASRFVGQHDNLDIVREFAGTITGEVDGKPYAGDFEEKP